MATSSPFLPRHVEIDLDGVEPDILRGGRNELPMRCVQSAIVEVERDPDSRRVREVMSPMSEYGFALRPRKTPDLRNVVFDRPALQ